MKLLLPFLMIVSAAAFQTPNSYTFGTEIVDMDKKESTFVKSLVHGKSPYKEDMYLNINGHGKVFNVLKLSDFKEMYLYSAEDGNDSCIKVPGSYDFKNLNPAILWNWSYNPKDKLYYGPMALLQFLTKDTFDESGNATITGIECSHVTLQIQKVNVDLYTALVTGNGYKKGDPVRLTVKGQLPIGGLIRSNNTFANLQYTFMPLSAIRTEDMDNFNVPVGMRCPNLENRSSTSFHDFGFDFSADINVADYDQETDSNALLADVQVTYSKLSGFYMISSNIYSNGIYSMLKKTTNLMKYGFIITEDYLLTDVTFCVLEKKFVSEIELFLPDGGKLVFNSPASIFNLTGTNFLGKNKKDGVPVEVYEKTIENYTGYNHQNFTQPYEYAVFTYYVTSPSVLVETDSISDDRIMVALEVRLWKHTKFQRTKLINFNFGFFNKVSDSEYFINHRKNYICSVSGENKMSVEITYTGVEDSTPYILQLKSDVSVVVSQSTNLIPLLITRAEITPTESGFLATVGFYDRPSAIYEFEDSERNMIISNKHNIVIIDEMVMSEESCAKKCLINEEHDCSYFTYCNFKCTLYYGTTKPQFQKVTSSDICISMKRRDDAFKKSQLMPFNEQIVSSLYKLISKNDIYRTLNVTLLESHKQKIKYGAIAATDDLVENGFITSGSIKGPDFRMIEFGEKLKEGKTTFQDIFLYFSPDECMKSCQETGFFYCNTFSYCAKSKKCTMSTLGSTEINDTIVQQHDCDVYSRQHISQYKRIPGIVIRSDGYEEKSAKTPDVCANMCSENSSIKTCESFDFCYTDDTCILHKTHFINVNSSSDLKHAVKCDHYSRDYRLDYLHSSTSVMSMDVVNYKVENITGEECARECALSKECLAYDYCNVGQSGLCQFSIELPKKVSKYLKFNPSCSHFELIDTESKKKYTPDKKTISTKETKTSTPNGYSSGAVAGIAIAMVILGVLVSSGVLYIIHRRRIIKK